MTTTLIAKVLQPCGCCGALTEKENLPCKGGYCPACRKVWRAIECCMQNAEKADKNAQNCRAYDDELGRMIFSSLAQFERQRAEEAYKYLKERK